jgi:metal-dependent hydrolase (beta-lactamase superfamily II)/CubicO group peptidase (beta-lactamase class C family)
MGKRAVQVAVGCLVLLLVIACGPVTPTAMLTQATATGSLPTATPLPPTSTSLPPTNTSLPPTSPVPPTAPLASPTSEEPLEGVRITIVYDNTAYDPHLEADWGFAALIEVPGHTLLFDTGGNGAILLQNMEALGIALQPIEAVVLSHEHGDHTGGLLALLDRGITPTVYVPAAFPRAYKDLLRRRIEVVEVTEPVEIVPGVHSTGQVRGAVVEQALVVQTTEGLVVITGCAHPGVVQMVRQAKAIVDGEVALVLGGFHMLDYGQSRIERVVGQFRDLGVRQVSPTHCTGEDAIAAFAQAYGDDYVPAGVGRVIVVGASPSGRAGSSIPTATAVGGLGASAAAPAWPTDGWRTSTPEAQGIDSQPLVEMLAEIQAQAYAIDSVLVVRNGVLVLEAYRHPYRAESYHIIHSCTKSIVSALVGIAVDDGFINGVDVRLLELFRDRTVDNVDARKRAMTLEHLLTMTTGLECRDSYLYRWHGLREMRQTEDWVQHVLDLPMVEAPGTRFEYCNGASLLLSAILQETTGHSAESFAQAHLFGSLGIEDVEWPANPQGISIGWGELRMRPQDMAKIGYLYLQNGRWEAEQVVPAAWVVASTRKQADGTLQAGYGYQWWVREDGVSMALGYAGQYIVVVPERALVAVFTSDLPEQEFYLPQRLLDDYILPAAGFHIPLPANPEAVERLEAHILSWASP